MAPSSLINFLLAFCLAVHVSYSACVESPPSLPEPCTYIETAYIPELTTVYAFGGNSSNSMFTWDISGATEWIDHGLVPIPEPVGHSGWFSYSNSVARIDNLLYFAGVTHFSPSMLIFDTNTNTWLDTSHIPDSPNGGTDGCVAHNITHLFLVGGSEVDVGDELQIYDIPQNVWSNVPMPMTGIAGKRYWGQFCYMNDNILYVFGGAINVGKGIDGMYKWQWSDGWDTIGTLPKPISTGDAEKHPFDNNIWIVGGFDADSRKEQDTIYQFNLETQSITNTYYMAMALDQQAIAFIGNDLYTFGGYDIDKTQIDTIQICHDFVDITTTTTTNAPDPSTSAPITAAPTTNEPSRSPTSQPTDDPSHAPSAKPTTSPTSVPTRDPSHVATEHPTQAPTYEPTDPLTQSPTYDPTDPLTQSPNYDPSAAPTSDPTNKPTTPAPQPPGTLLCGDTDTGTYNGETLSFMVNLPHKGDLTFDSSSSFFNITAMEATNEEETILLENDYDHDEIITLYNMDIGNYKFSINGGTNTDVQYQIKIICPTSEPTPAPTYLPTYSPTRTLAENPTLAPTDNPTNKPTIKPSINPTKAPTSNPTKSPILPTTSLPSQTPTKHPTKAPSQPTVTPTFAPTSEPSTATRTPTKTPLISTITTDVLDGKNDIQAGESKDSEHVQLAIIGLGLGGITFCLMASVYYFYTKKAKRRNTINIMMNNDNVGGMQSNTIVSNLEMQTNVITPNERYNAVLVSWFLHTIQLPEYLKIFVDNGYDDVLMLELIEDRSQLIEIGVVCHEHQQLILKEIDKLRARERKQVVKKMKPLKPPPAPTTPYAEVSIKHNYNEKQRVRAGEKSVYERGASEFKRTVEGYGNDVDVKSELFNNVLFKRKKKKTVSGGMDV